MKKIYLTLAGLATFGSIYSQEAIGARKPAPSQIIANPHAAKTNNVAAKTTGGPGHVTNSIFAENVIDLKQLTSGTDFNVYANPIYMDSTVVTSSSSGTSNVFNMKAGANFDPKSIYWNGLGTQLLTSADPYTVDSVWLGLRYEKVNFAVNDTLIVEFAWAPPATATVYQALTINSQTPALVFRCPKVSANALSGDKSYFTAPAANYKKIKRVLTNADTSRFANNGYIIIPNVNQLVPAGNIFSTAYTYKPGSTVPAGSIVHQYTGGSAQTHNGIIAFLYSDPASTSNYAFYDPTSFSTGLDYSTKQRYNLYTGGSAFLNTTTLPLTEGGWDIGFSVSWANSSVGVKELQNNGFTLSQNVPNPTSGTSTVSYQLVKEAGSVIFTVTDVMGRIISSEKAASSTGAHTISLGSYAAGVYYYSISVDGKSITKKMIAQ
jgi:Secretion system C-terminal sorting domain